MDKATLLKTLTETRAVWEALLAQIDEEQMQKPGAAGKWSVKGVTISKREKHTVSNRMASEANLPPGLMYKT
jgi:hypothetical protein